MSLLLFLAGYVTLVMGLGFLIGAERFYNACARILDREQDEAASQGE